MRAGSPVNADPTKVAVMKTQDMPWEPTGHPGVSRKVLEFVDDPVKGRETSLLRFEPGAALPSETLADRMEIFVLEGTYADGHGEYGEHTFLRNPAGFRHAPASPQGCTLYVKWRVPIYRDRTETERLVIDAKTAKWLEFPHRGADVLHLYRDPNGLETGRIGHVHTGRKIPSHDHSIGEETLVLRGVLKDEYTAYTAGTWFRMPCGVPHAPYTEAERCMMLIREGDLVW